MPRRVSKRSTRRLNIPKSHQVGHSRGGVGGSGGRGGSISIQDLTEGLQLSTSISDPGVDTKVATEKAVRDAIGAINPTIINNEVIDEVTGFSDPTECSFAFDNETRTFSITPTGDSFVFYAFGTRYEKSEAESVVIEDTNGLWYISYNTSGELTASQTIWNLATEVPVASVYWDGAEGTVDQEEPPASPKPGKLSDLYILSAWYPSAIPSSLILMYHVIAGGEKVVLPKRLPFSYAAAQVATAAETTFVINVNDVQKGTLVFPEASVTGSFTWNSKVTLSGGDEIKIIAPAVADAQLSGVAVTIKGTRK